MRIERLKTIYYSSLDSGGVALKDARIISEIGRGEDGATSADAQTLNENPGVLVVLP